MAKPKRTRRTITNTAEAFERMTTLIRFYDSHCDEIGKDEDREVTEALVKALNVLGPVVEMATGEVMQAKESTKYVFL